MNLPAALGRLTGAVSGRSLFFAVAAVSLGLLFGFCVVVLSAANRAEDRLIAAVEDRLLSRLEEDGISGLATALGEVDRALIPGQDRIEAALWQRRPGNRVLLSETGPGVAAAFDTGTPQAVLGNTRFRLRQVDVAAASADWVLEMTDVDLRFGIALPSHEVITARRTIIAFAGAFGAALLAALSLEFVHWRRYRRGIEDINALLERYSAGETGVRIDSRLPAPELQLLGRQLNTVLPKLDALFADLRAISAHLAHELKNPLQAIRSDVRLIEAEADREKRAAIAAGVDRTIDTANARLEAVMQLFRLQADVEVPMTSGVRLDELVEDIAYDHSDALEGRGLQLSLDIAPGIAVEANPQLVELMVDNLMSNAEHYSETGGEVRVVLTGRDDHFRLDIENPGTLPARLEGRAFKRFQRGEDRGAPGSAGLGLALVDVIAQRHGFEVSLTGTGDNRVRARVTGSAKIVG